MPSASTLHGELPVVETINKPSPKPKKTSPKQRKKDVKNFGLKFSGFFELQVFLGIFFYS